MKFGFFREFFLAQFRLLSPNPYGFPKNSAFFKVGRHEALQDKNPHRQTRTYRFNFPIDFFGYNFRLASHFREIRVEIL
jgi:hypothetical protein